METPLVDPAILIVQEPELPLTGNRRIAEIVLELAPKEDPA
jgi:hypothetical protein